MSSTCPFFVLQECVKAVAGREEAEVAARISTGSARLPEDFLGSAAAPSSLSGVLVSEVLAFLRPEQLAPTFEALFGALAPGGTLALTCVSVFLSRGFMLPLIEQKKAAGHAWPGFADEAEVTALLQKALQARAASGRPASKEEADMLSGIRSFHYLTEEEVGALAVAAGFEVVSLGYGTHDGYPLTLKGAPGEPYYGMFNVQLVARKPTSAATVDAD